MKAIGIRAHHPADHPEALVDLEVDTPVPGPRDLLVEVKAVSVNPVDCKVRSGAVPSASLPRVLGWDVAGTVRAVGADVTLFKPGDDVYYAGSLGRPGGQCELHAVDERIVGRKPRNIDFAHAAALPLTAITAWETLFDALAVPRDESGIGKVALLLGGVGGVGSIMVQLAAKLTRLRVVATASRPESRAKALELGASLVIDHSRDMVAQLRAEGIRGVDYIACFNHTEQHFPALTDLVKPLGSICLIAVPAAPVSLGALSRKSPRLSFELMFTRPLFQTPDMIEQHRLLCEVATLVESGVIRTTLGQNFGELSAANVRRAHQAIETGRTIGKIVLAR